jgi:hypothetical protein
MAAGDLTTPANALQWIGLTTDDGTVARLITALSVQIQKFLGYQVASANYARTLNGVGGRKLMLPDRPVTAVTSLTIDGHPVPESPNPFTPGFVFDDKILYLRGWYEFRRGAQNIAAAYTAGYAATPPDIEQACLDWIKIVHDNLDTLPGLKSLKAGDSQIEYGSALAVLGNTTIPMPASIAADLILYKRVSQA